MFHWTKTTFPYNLLNENLKEHTNIEPTMFNNEEEYTHFKNKYGEHINIFKILEEYCKNDVKITKQSIIKYWDIINSTGFIKKKKKY